MSRGRKSPLPAKRGGQGANNSTIEMRRTHSVETDNNGRELSVENQEFRAWMGALPHPNHLEKFDLIIPNGAERIMQLTEKEQAHRINMEEKALPENFRALKRGQYFGAAISIIALILAALTSYLGAHPTVSIALVSVPVFAVAKAFLDHFVKE